MLYTGPDERLGALQQVVADLVDGVLTVTLARPEHHNRMNVAMTLAMQALLRAVLHDPAVRVVVMRGQGDDFCAGMDTADFCDATEHGEMALRAAVEAANHWRVRLLRQLPQPVIAMVHGRCQGGAIAIVESCDIVFAAHDAQFVLPEPAPDGGVALAGEVPTGPVAKAVSRVMTPRSAAYHALSGQPFDGIEAERNGLVTRSFPLAELERETSALAAEFVAKDALALQFTKQTLQHVGSMSWDGVLDYTAAKFAELKSLQAGRPSARAAAVESFLAGKSKPGLGG